MLLDALSLKEDKLKALLASGYEKDVAEKITIISIERSDEIFRTIQLHKGNRPALPVAPGKKVIGLSRRWMAVAACMTGLLAIGLLFYYNNSSNQPRLVATQSTRQLHRAVNNTGKPLEITLEDGSDIILDPQTAISYYLPFSNKRDVSLTGKATFRVAKDANKPFRVFANNITTTALGTKFSVATFDQEVLIQLMEGKVVVRSTENTVPALRDTYLRPGQQVFISQRTGIYTVNVFEIPDEDKIIRPAGIDSNRDLKTNKVRNIYALIFNKQL